jgi:mRNA interferase RelE/StbE
MRIKFSKNAIKFLNSLPLAEQERIQDKLKTLIKPITESASIPFQELDIKNLKGEWKGYQRMRISKI